MQYADDTTVVIQSKLDSILDTKMLPTFEIIGVWFYQNSLKMNQDKTNIVNFCLQRNSSTISVNTDFLF